MTCSIFGVPIKMIGGEGLIIHLDAYSNYEDQFLIYSETS
jgi:hypothetical protein